MTPKELRFEALDFFGMCVDSVTIKINSRIDAYFEDAKVIYGQLSVQEHVWNTKNPEWHDTHRALLVGVEKIKRGVSTKKLVEELRGVARVLDQLGSNGDCYRLIADQIESEGLIP